MTFDERMKNAINHLNIVHKGAVYFAHYDLINFGSENKKFHFVISIDSFKNNFNSFRTHPLTSKFIKDNRIFILNLELDSNINLGEHQKKRSSVLLFMIRTIKYSNLSTPDLILYKGSINQNKFTELMAAKQKLIKSYFTGQV